MEEQCYMEDIRSQSPAPAVPVSPSAGSRGRRAYPAEIRLQAAALHDSGLGYKRIGKALGIECSVVREWLRRYRKYGAESLQPFWRCRERQEQAAARKAPVVRQDGSALHERYREALRLYSESDLTRSEVCRLCGVGYQSFSYYLRRYHPEYVRPPRRGGSAYHREQREQCRRKYRKAVLLYSTTSLSCKSICEQTGVSLSGFRRHIRVYHRDLLLQRHRVRAGKREASLVRLRRHGCGQTLPGRAKYKDAIAACADDRYLAYNVSQIASLFHLGGTQLGSQLRLHYPEILSRREEARARLGLGDGRHRGARPWCVERYAAAVELLRTTDLTIGEVASSCGVSPSGLKGHLLQYHKDVVSLRASRRASCVRSKREGALNGTGSVNRPRADKSAHFAAAVELYRTTSLTVREIAARTGTSPGGLRHHLHRWHRSLVLERRGITPDGSNEYMDLRGTKHYLKSTASKYAAALDRLRLGASSLAGVASSFGFNAETFRSYVSEHAPDLALRFGRVRLPDGRSVLSRSRDKYSAAVELYRTTCEPLKSIAFRLGLVYNSLGGFVRRNHPDAIEAHRELVRRGNAQGKREKE